MTNPTGSQAGTSTQPANEPKHWTLKAPIEMSKVTPFYGKLGTKLSTSNYVAWARIVETALRSIGIFGYCDGSIALPTDVGEQIYWRQADMAVQGVLLTNMEDDIITQLDMGIPSKELWIEIKHLFAGQTMADYTLTISNLINTKYGGGDEDVIEHITKMKRFHQDLILMGRDIDDQIFACFLRLSMPQEDPY